MPTRTTRRTFLKLTTAAASITAAEFSHAMPGGSGIALIVDPGSAITASEPVQWAAEMFRQALTAKGIPISGSTFTVLVSPLTGPVAKEFGGLPDHLRSESTALIPGKHNNSPAILVTGTDARGIVYGLLELTERVRTNDNPVTARYINPRQWLR